MSRLGLILLAALALLAFVGPALTSDPLRVDLDARLQSPGGAHWMGTDELGRDVVSRLVHGARPSLLVAVIATGVSLILGVSIGAAAGFGGRALDLALSQIISASLSFPALIMLLLLAALTISPSGGGVSSLAIVGCAVGVARWGFVARCMRAEVMRLSRTDVAVAARAAGASSLRTLAVHLIPCGAGPVLTLSAFGAGTAVVAEASLSFLGMGVQPPTPTWGQMIASASAFGTGCWWLLLFPGAMVALTVAAFNLVGESLRQRGRAA